jgi:hypothetical protein
MNTFAFASRSLKRAFTRTLVAAVCAAALPAAMAASDCPRPAGGGATPQRVAYGVTGLQTLITFKTCRPDKWQIVGAFSGLTGADSAVIAIDFRVQDGLLYALGNGGGLYTVDLLTAAATKVSQLSTPLDGTRFAIDFNPAANALRIISDSGQNLRHPFFMPEPRTTLVDPPLNYTPGTAAAGVVAIGYTNNDLDANTGTTLFDIDATLNQVVIQAPANNGSLSVAGKLGVDPDLPIGFDVHSRLVNGAASTNVGFASMNIAGQWGFYRIDLLTGDATLLGPLDLTLADIAVSLDH